MVRQNQLFLGVLVVLVLLGGGWWYMQTNQTTSPATTATTTPAPTVKNQISIKSNAFVPDTLNVKVGDTVTWVNEESYGHNVVGDAGLFTSPKLATGEKFSFTYTKEGTFTYICSIHPFMHGTIVVTK